MSLRLYLDDCMFARRLRDISIEHGHEVVTPLDAGLLGVDDDVHFAYASEQGLIVLTANPKDFVVLHRQHPDHSGVFAVYQDNDLRDMSYDDVAKAIQNIIDANVAIAGQFHVLNMWRF